MSPSLLMDKERLCAATALAAALQQLASAAKWGSKQQPFLCDYGGKLPAREFWTNSLETAYNSIVQDVGHAAADDMWDSMVLDLGTQSELQDDSFFLVVCMVSLGKVCV